MDSLDSSDPIRGQYLAQPNSNSILRVGSLLVHSQAIYAERLGLMRCEGFTQFMPKSSI